VASIKMKMPDDFLNKLSNLGTHTDEIVSKVLMAGAEVVEKEVRDDLQSVIGKDTKHPSQSTGQLIASLGTASVKQDRDGVFNVKIGFAENRSDGKSNAMIASVIEYGKSNQKAKPFLKPALRKSKDACVNAMVRKLDEEVSKL